MKYVKMLGLAVAAAVVMTAFAVSAATATTLEVGGIARTDSVELTASLTAGTSSVTKTTGQTFANTCGIAHLNGSTSSPFTGVKVTIPLTSWSFSKCTEEALTVDKPGKLYVEYKSGTNGTVFSEETEVTMPTPFGKVNCKTGAGTDIGTLTGVASGNTVVDINAVMNCGFLLPSAVWEGSYTITSPAGLGVTA